MKIRGIDVHCGLLVFLDRQTVPPAFWARLKHEAAKAKLLDALADDYRAERAKVEAERQYGWQTVHDEFDAEQKFYRRWVERLHGPQDVWPWSRGWTDEMVDAYPVTAAVREAA
jgi:hypothetical protein